MHLQDQGVLVFQRQRFVLRRIGRIRTSNERAVIGRRTAARYLGWFLRNKLSHSLVTGLHNREWNNDNVIRSGRSRHQGPLEGGSALSRRRHKVAVLVVNVQIEVVV